jgi:recombination protein RecT
MTGKSQELVPLTPAQDLAQRVRGDEFQSQIALVLPGDVSAARFARAAATALLANPDIASCDNDSIYNALLKSAQDGLLPDGREAALVKFNGKSGAKAQYMPMIGGFRKIAAESGWSITAKCVYEKEEFEAVEGSNPSLTHHPVRPGEERGEIIAAYAIGRKRGEEPLFKVMTLEEIEKVRSVSRAKASGPWVEWFDRMAQKTVARALFKELPLGDLERVRRVLEATSLEPGESVELLYGSPERAALTPAPPVDVTPEPSVKSDSDGGDQEKGEEAVAASAESTSTGGASSSDPDSESEPSLEQEPAKPVASFQAPPDIAGVAAEIARVSAVKIPAESDESAGLTLQEVKEKGAVGERWLAWQLKTRKFDSIADDVERFVELVMPDLWKRYQDDKAKAEASAA